MNVLGYHVFDVVSESWLQDDECSWGGYNGAASFTSHELAKEIGERENIDPRRVLCILCDCGGVVA